MLRLKIFVDTFFHPIPVRLSKPPHRSGKKFSRSVVYLMPKIFWVSSSVLASYRIDLLLVCGH